LNTPRLLPRLNHRRAKRFEDGFGLPDRCYVAGADVQPDYAAFCFASQRRNAFLNKLDVPTVTASDVAAKHSAILG
jgi:hypothetical protein